MNCWNDAEELLAPTEPEHVTSSTVELKKPFLIENRNVKLKKP